MAFELNEKVVNLVPYDPICGTYSIRLDANESYITMPDYLLEKVEKAVKSVQFNRYPDPLARGVCKAFADYYGIDANFVTAFDGSDESISVVMNAFLQKGDKVMTLSPDFSMYKFYSSIVECECITLEKNKDFTFDVDEIIKTVNDNDVRILIFSNPCNPSSVGCDAQGVRRIIKETNALVVLDEAYMDFWNQSLMGEFNDYDNLIILRTCSKAVGMAAIRLGFCVANKKITDVLRSVKSPYNVNSVTQAIGETILCEKEYLKSCVNTLIERRDELYAQMKNLESEFPNKLSVVEPNTNFVYTEFDNAEALFEYLKGNGIVVRKMGSFLRITAGSSDENSAVVQKIRKYLSEEV